MAAARIGSEPAPPASTGKQVNGSTAAKLRSRQDNAATATQPAAVEPRTRTQPKLRRSRLAAIGGVLALAVGGLLAAFVATSVGSTKPVLALQSNVSRGEVLTAEDLTVTQLNRDSTLKTIPAKDRGKVIGLRAAVDLAAGTNLTATSLTAQTIPAAGQSMVSVTLTPAQQPAQDLRPGDLVRVVDTPRAGGEPPQDAPSSTSATVVTTRAIASTGQLIVGVSLPTGDAAKLASHAATGRVALVLDSEAR